MSRIANLLGAILFASICLAAAVLAGAGAKAGQIDAKGAAPQVCCVYMIF